MKAHFGVLVALVCLFGSAAALFGFDCNIYGYGDDSCAVDGTITCSDTTTEFGPYCTLTDGACGVGACDATGAFPDCAAGVCVCREGYHGTTCDTERISATCDASGMTISVEPYTQRIGGALLNHGIYVSQTTTIDFAHACKDETAAAYSKTIPFAGTDGDCPYTMTADGSGYYELYVYYKHNANMYTASDALYHVKCKPGGEATPTSSEYTVAQVNTAGLPTVESTHDEVDNFIMDLKTGDAVPFSDIAGDMALGSWMNLIVQHPSVFAITSCEASTDSAFPPGDTTFTFIDAVCIPSPFNALFKGVVEYNDGSDSASVGGTDTNHVFRIPLGAFRFTDSGVQTLYLRCTCCLDGTCQSATTDCNSDPIPDLSAALLTANNALPTLARRRRRQAQTVGASNTTTLNVAVSVQDPSNVRVTIEGNGGEAGEVEADVESCYKSVSVILPIILLAVLLLVAMAMTFFFFSKLRSEKQSDGTVNMAYKS